MVNSYAKAVLDGDLALKVVLEFEGSVFRPDAMASLVGAAGLTGEVVIHHRDGRTAKAMVANLQKVTPGEDGGGLVAIYFQEAPVESVLEGMPDPEVAELKKQIADSRELLLKVSAKVDTQAADLKALAAAGVKTEAAIAALSKDLELLKAAVKAGVEAAITKAAPKPAPEAPAKQD